MERYVKLTHTHTHTQKDRSGKSPTFLLRHFTSNLTYSSNSRAGSLIAWEVLLGTSVSSKGKVGTVIKQEDRSSPKE